MKNYPSPCPRDPTHIYQPSPTAIPLYPLYFQWHPPSRVFGSSPHVWRSPLRRTRWQWAAMTTKRTSSHSHPAVAVALARRTHWRRSLPSRLGRQYQLWHIPQQVIYWRSGIADGRWSCMREEQGGRRLDGRPRSRGNGYSTPRRSPRWLGLPTVLILSLAPRYTNISTHTHTHKHKHTHDRLTHHNEHDSLPLT